MKNKPFFLITLFPTLYCWFSLIGNNNNMRVFYFVFLILIGILFLHKEHYKISRHLVILCIFIGLKLAYDCLVYPTSLGDDLEFAALLLILFFTADIKLRKGYYDYLVSHERSITIIYILYYLGILVSFILGIATTDVWATFSVQGPYGLAHIFSYELLIIGIISYILWERTKHIRWIIILGISGLLILLSTVRTVILCVVIMIGYTILMKKGWKKLVYFCLIVVTTIVLYRLTPLFTYVMEKTTNAIANGSITNNRLKIWTSSFQFYLNAPLREKILGSGLEELLAWNLRMIRLEVQAHNDFLTVLCSFGVLSLIVYLILFFRSSRNSGGIGYFLSVSSLVLFNGLYSYCSFVIGLIAFRLFFDLISNEDVGDLHCQKTEKEKREYFGKAS